MANLHPLFMDVDTDSDVALASEPKDIAEQSLTCWVHRLQDWWMVDNSRYQVDSCTLMCQFSAFDLKSSEDQNSCSQEISELCSTFGVDVKDTV